VKTVALISCLEEDLASHGTNERRSKQKLTIHLPYRSAVPLGSLLLSDIEPLGSSRSGSGWRTNRSVILVFPSQINRVDQSLLWKRPWLVDCGGSGRFAPFPSPAEFVGIQGLDRRDSTEGGQSDKVATCLNCITASRIERDHCTKKILKAHVDRQTSPPFEMTAVEKQRQHDQLGSYSIQELVSLKHHR
jgi:hypothetical protein